MSKLGPCDPDPVSTVKAMTDAPRDEALCKVCGKLVADADQDEHLKSQHLGPHYFWFEGRGYRTDKPSMTVAEFLAMMDRKDGPSIVEHRDGELIYLCHGEAIDLTRRPQLFVDLPATI